MLSSKPCSLELPPFLNALNGSIFQEVFPSWPNPNSRVEFKLRIPVKDTELIVQSIVKCILIGPKIRFFAGNVLFGPSERSYQLLNDNDAMGQVG